MPPSSLPNSYYEASVTRPPPSPPLAGEATCDTCDTCVIGGWTGAPSGQTFAATTQFHEIHPRARNTQAP